MNHFERKLKMKLLADFYYRELWENYVDSTDTRTNIAGDNGLVFALPDTQDIYQT